MLVFTHDELQSGRNAKMTELSAEHPGIMKMKTGTGVLLANAVYYTKGPPDLIPEMIMIMMIVL